MNSLHNEWIKMPECIRSQLLARDLFGLKVDMATGMIAEPKPTGGVRLSPLPDYVWRDKSDKAVRAALHARGWRVDVRALPRSGRVTVAVINVDKNLRAVTPAMPEIDAIRYAGLLAMELEKNGGSDLEGSA